VRLEISCTECSDQIAPGESRTVYSRVCLVRNDGVYEFECPQGHHTTTVLRTPKHEVLYTIGANAFLDGYFRDGIASFAGALERYYEFALRVVSRQKEFAPDAFEAIWKVMSKQSERQFGAFIAVWLLETGKPYTSLPQKEIDKQTNLRNDVVHKGKIPTLEECVDYGQYVLDVVAPIEQVLLANYAAAHKDECFADARNVSKAKSLPITVLSIFSVFNASLQSDCKLEPALTRLRELRKRDGFPIVGVEYSKSRAVTHLIKPR
jgi:hypothetical protein